MLTLLQSSIRAFIHGRDAAVAIIVAIALPIVLGLSILAIDYGMALVVRSQNQRTADVAVYAAAVTFGQVSAVSQNPLADARAEAVHLLGLNGANPDDLTLNLLPQDEDGPRLELLIAQDLPPVGLISLRGPDGLRVVVRSVARVGSTETEPATCLFSTSTTVPFRINGASANMNLNECALRANAGFTFNPSRSNLACLSPEDDDDCDWQFVEESLDPLNITWERALEICKADPRTQDTTDLADFVSSQSVNPSQNPLAPGAHCIPESSTTTFAGGKRRITDNGAGVTLFFEDEVELTIRGNFDLELTAAEIALPDGSPRVLFYGPDADLDIAGNSTFNSLGCFGITMREITIGGAVSFLSGEGDCDPARDLGGAQAGVELLE